MGKQDDKSGNWMPLMIFLIPFIAMVMIIPALCAEVAKFLGLPENVGYAVGAIILLSIAYSIYDGSLHVHDSPCLGRSGSMYPSC